MRRGGGLSPWGAGNAGPGLVLELGRGKGVREAGSLPRVWPVGVGDGAEEGSPAQGECAQ